MVSFRFELTSLVKNFVSKSKHFLCALETIPNRERLDSSCVMNILYTRAALNTPSGHLPSPREFSKDDDDDTDE